ncbi:CbtA family protein [Rhodopseudomonas palustris]|uniref:Cobalt transporter n=1 Tax=Rhodopseudomonas palustris (strain BisB18) TaxID=316056 RepID=Q214Y2_RHOPB
MVRTLLIRGMLVGILAGLLAGGFAYLFGEPQVDLAIAFEEHAAGAAAEAEPELVSRAVQSTFGLFTGIVVVGCALGGIFGLAFAYVHGRLGRWSPSVTAALLAATGFVVLVVVPQLKYPANPPAVGSADTIATRTGFYFLLLGLSVAVAIAALGTGRQLVARLGRWGAALTGIAIYAIAMACVMLALPSINEVPADFSTELLWKFRAASFGIGAVLWATLGVAFGLLTERQFAAGRIR